MFKKLRSLYLASCLLLVTAVSSFAALSIEQAAVVTATETMVADYLAMTWGLVLLVMGGLVGVTLFKKFFRKGTA